MPQRLFWRTVSRNGHAVIENFETDPMQLCAILACESSGVHIPPKNHEDFEISSHFSNRVIDIRYGV
jgi:hypothetical protein